VIFSWGWDEAPNIDVREELRDDFSPQRKMKSGVVRLESGAVGLKLQAKSYAFKLVACGLELLASTLSSKNTFP
jgi:hypothetical protein